jgi:sulfite reductase alpha subunit-like flavoprotein
MKKHKPATASKHVRRPKIVAKAQRAKQAIVRSPKNSSPRSVTDGSTESLPEPNDSPQQVSLVHNPTTAAQDDFKQTIRDSDSKSGFDLPSATANLRAYQAKLLEIAQANMQFAFEFAQRFATIRSPVEFLKVIEELSSRRIAMFRKYSKEMAELGIHR